MCGVKMIVLALAGYGIYKYSGKYLDIKLKTTPMPPVHPTTVNANGTQGTPTTESNHVTPSTTTDSVFGKKLKELVPDHSKAKENFQNKVSNYTQDKIKDIVKDAPSKILPFNQLSGKALQGRVNGELKSRVNKTENDFNANRDLVKKNRALQRIVKHHQKIIENLSLNMIGADRKNSSKIMDVILKYLNVTDTKLKNFAVHQKKSKILHGDNKYWIDSKNNGTGSSGRVRKERASQNGPDNDCKKKWHINFWKTVDILPEALVYAMKDMQKENNKAKHPLDPLLSNQTRTFLKTKLKTLFS